MPKENIVTKYYLRLRVEDKAGMLARVSKILGDRNISIEKMIQKPLNETCAHLLFSTHKCREKDIISALTALEEEGAVTAKPVMIRIED